MVSVLRSLAISAGFMGPMRRRHFPAKSCFSTKENTFGVGFKLTILPQKQQGPGSQRQPRPSLAYGVQSVRGEKGQRCFAEQRRIGAVVCSPTRVYLSRMQLPAWSLERSLRCGLGSELPSWLQGDCRDLHPEGIFLPTPASPRRRTCLEWISRSGEHQQSSKAQGARGSPDPIWPMETQWLGVEKGQRCSAEQRCICTAVCSPRRVDVSRMQLSEPRLGRG